MGESKLKRTGAKETLLSCVGVQTPSGKIHVHWESSSVATPMGQLTCFIEFLGLTGSRWQETCPLTYASPNAPSKADVLGTWMLSVLSGHKRYSHVTAIRCDGVNLGLLCMNKVISEDALRRALTTLTLRKASPPCLTPPGFSTSTPRSSRSMASRKVSLFRTTQRSRAVPRIATTPT
jgi:hypothetical protein